MGNPVCIRNTAYLRLSALRAAHLVSAVPGDKPNRLADYAKARYRFALAVLDAVYLAVVLCAALAAAELLVWLYWLKRAQALRAVTHPRHSLTEETSWP